MSIWWRHSLSPVRTSQTCAFVFEHRSKLTRCYKQLDFIVAVWVIFWEYPFPGKVGSDLGEENPITSINLSELGEYPTYIIRLSRRFLWEIHHKSTVLEILSELSEDRLKRVRLRRGLLYMHLCTFAYSNLFTAP